MKGFKPRLQVTAAEHIPVATKAYNELRRQILHGELPAGSQLNEIQTATDLGISRTPLREALRELLNDGLVSEGPRRSCLVAEGSPELEREVRLMRVSLETLTAREAALVHLPNDTDILRLTMIRMNRALQANDLHTALDFDDEFHVRIAQLADLPLVADTVHRLRGLTRLNGLARGWDPTQLEKSATDHDAIIEAIDTRDPDIAEKALRNHLS